MKLKNKKTGEIKDFALVIANSDVEDTTLAELCEEWTDYEEPKEYWYIGYKNIVRRAVEPFNSGLADDGITQKRKEIGNYFETEEEAELAVRKLKAWKRLKEKGFRFCSWFYDIENQEIEIKAKFKGFEEVIVGQKRQDLDLLFGGEE